MKFPLRMEPGCELLVLGSSKHRSLCQRSQRHSGVFAENLTVRCFQVGEYLAFCTESIAKKLPIRYSLTIRKCFESTLQVRRFTILKMFFINIPNSFSPIILIILRRRFTHWPPWFTRSKATYRHCSCTGKATQGRLPRSRGLVVDEKLGEK